MREWIEMHAIIDIAADVKVLPRMREWIEIIVSASKPLR